MNLLSSLFVFCLISNFQNGEWKYFGTLSNNYKYYVKSAYDDGFEKKMWVKKESSNLKYYKHGASGTFKYTNGYEISLEGFNCVKRTNKVYQTAVYNKNGALLDNHSFGVMGSEENYITPETIGEALMNEACN